MNQLAHIFITYSALFFLIPNANKYLLPIAIFSIILDLDHVPSYIKVAFMKKKERKKLSTENIVDLMRTPIQEPIGIITLIVIFGLLYIFGVNNYLLFIAGACFAIHWLIDFLTVHTRPFAPLNKKIFCLFFKTKKQRITSEIVITIISGIIFLALIN
jgi:hypothetical protein